jgi:SAM-dependent methyltransferase
MDRELGAVQRRHWDADAARYHDDHADYLDTFHWCPERLTEDEARLLGDPAELAGRTVIEVGCGSAPCAAWLARHTAAQVVGLDISHGMLRRAPHVPGLRLLQADAASLPMADHCADVVFSSFGGYPFLADLDAALVELARVLRPGGRAVIAVNHPTAWIFPDDPDDLTASIPYFQDAYLEWDDGDGEDGEDGDDTAGPGLLRHLRYAEFHHTMGDWVRAVAGAGLQLVDLVEPEWRDGTPTWGQWSQARGRVFPGTAIFVLTA